MSQATSIEWGKSWNPVKGLCPHSSICEYCYMAGFHKRFKMNPELRLDEKALARIPKADRIFVCSNLDLLADAIPDTWIQQVIAAIYKRENFRNMYDIRHYNTSKYMFLTKNPRRYADFEFPSYVWLGTSWDGLDFTKDNIEKMRIHAPLNNKWFISLEPLLADPQKAGVEILGFSWIIIGADSRKGQPKPPKEWADYLIQQAREYNIPVFVKENYGYPERIKEFPE